MPVSAFFARELAPTPRRITEAARTAIKATLTTGLSAIMQIAGPFGPLFAFRIGQPGISFGLFEGAITIIFAAVIQAAIVRITGVSAGAKCRLDADLKSHLNAEMGCPS